MPEKCLLWQKTSYNFQLVVQKLQQRIHNCNLHYATHELIIALLRICYETKKKGKKQVLFYPNIFLSGIFEDLYYL